MKHIVAVLLAAPALALAVMPGTAHAAAEPPPVPEVVPEGPGQTPTPTVTEPTPPTVTGPISADPCICTKEYNPVLGSDGKVYSNPCMAGCAGVKVVPPGGVPPRPHHPPIWKRPHHHQPWWIKFEVTFGHGERPVRPQPSIEELCPDDLPPGAVC